MSLAIFQFSVAGHSALPRDRFVTTAWFDVDSVSIIEQTDWDNLASDALNAWSEQLGSPSREISVKVYMADDPKPRPIKAQKTQNVGQSGNLTYPGEVALCLSFYGERNLPRTRGRMFLPLFGITGSPGDRPTVAQMNSALSWADKLANLGGVNVDWCWHSPTAQNHGPVKHAYVDDEWDTQRSRGRKSENRVTRTLNE